MHGVEHSFMFAREDEFNFLPQPTFLPINLLAKHIPKLPLAVRSNESIHI